MYLECDAEEDQERLKDKTEETGRSKRAVKRNYKGLRKKIRPFFETIVKDGRLAITDVRSSFQETVVI